MLVSAVGAIYTESQLVHVTFFDVIQTVLKGTLQLLALSCFHPHTTYGHALWVKLVQEATAFPFHAHAPQPEGTYSLQDSSKAEVTGAAGATFKKS